MTTPINGIAARSTGREVARLRRQYRVRRVVTRIGVYLTAIGVAAVCAFPFVGSLLAVADRSTGSFPLGPLVANTAIVGGLVVAITLALALPAAFALTRLNRPWGTRTGIAIFGFYLVPPALLFVSLSRAVAALGLRTSIWSMVLVYPAITIPVAVWLLMGFLRTVPTDLEEQAMIDGYSRGGAFARVVLPLIVPGLVAVAVFVFTLVAGEFLYALTFVPSGPAMTIGTGVADRLPGHLESLQAVTVIVAIPIAFVFNLVLDRLIEGFGVGVVGMGETHELRR
jgi:multiple sugar transport system permease protein